MTRAGSLLLTGLMIAALAVLPAAAGPGPKGAPGTPGAADAPSKVVVRHAGDQFCPTTPLGAGGVVIPAGRCYMLSVLRDSGGTFLAFVPQGTRIPPGQLVRLNTPAGPKLKGRLFLVPLSTTRVLLPLNTMTLVAATIQYLATQVIINLTGLPAPVPPIPFRDLR